MYISCITLWRSEISILRKKPINDWRVLWCKWRLEKKRKWGDTAESKRINLHIQHNFEVISLIRLAKGCVKWSYINITYNHLGLLLDSVWSFFFFVDSCLIWINFVQSEVHNQNMRNDWTQSPLNYLLNIR